MAQKLVQVKIPTKMPKSVPKNCVNPKTVSQLHLCVAAWHCMRIGVLITTLITLSSWKNSKIQNMNKGYLDTSIFKVTNTLLNLDDHNHNHMHLHHLHYDIFVVSLLQVHLLETWHQMHCKLLAASPVIFVDATNTLSSFSIVISNLCPLLTCIWCIWMLGPPMWLFLRFFWQVCPSQDARLLLYYIIILSSICSSSVPFPSYGVPFASSKYVEYLGESIEPRTAYQQITVGLDQMQSCSLPYQSLSLGEYSKLLGDSWWSSPAQLGSYLQAQHPQLHDQSVQMHLWHSVQLLCPADWNLALHYGLVMVGVLISWQWCWGGGFGCSGVSSHIGQACNVMPGSHVLCLLQHQGKQLHKSLWLSWK